jgi:ATP-binding cassette subfamily F protein 3
VILISHDRHMVELTADRLVLVDGGTAREYAGSMDDYIDFILGRNQPKGGGSGKGKGQRGGNALADMRAAQSDLTKAEAAVARCTSEVAELDQRILAISGQGGAQMQTLLTQRARAAEALAKAEEAWLAAGSLLETLESA